VADETNVSTWSWLHDPVTTQILSALSDGDKVPNAVAQEVTFANRVTVWRRINNLAALGLIELKPIGERFKLASAKWGAIADALSKEYARIFAETRNDLVLFLKMASLFSLKKSVLAEILAAVPEGYSAEIQPEEVVGTLQVYRITGKGGIGLAPLFAVHKMLLNYNILESMSSDVGDAALNDESKTDAGFWAVVAYAYLGPILDIRRYFGIRREKGVTIEPFMDKINPVE